MISHRDGVRLESDTLYALIRVVASSPNLDRVLDGVVDILTEATRCHACFVYLCDRERLCLRAASPVYRHLVGELEFGLDEGLAGWVARNRSPAFIRENAMADPRMKYVPEIEEERFESIVAVPVPARSGETIGVVVLHTEAPREFDEDALSFLVHTASLVAGAIENAQLYEIAGRRVQTLTRLSALSQEIAGVASREELYSAVTGGVRQLLGCDACRLYLLDPATGRLELAAADPAGEPSPWPSEGGGVLLDLLRRSEGASPLMAAPVTAGDEDLGVLAVAATAARSLGEGDDELLRGVGHQLAVALKKAELIERLTAENVVRDLFEAVEAELSDVAEARARVAGCDLARRHVFVQVEASGGNDDSRPWPAVADRAEARLRRLAPGAVCDAGRDSVRAMLPLRQGPVEEAFAELSDALREIGAAERLLIGVSGQRRGVVDGSRSLSEAGDAARIARALVRGGGALAYSDLGAYRYLVRLPTGEVPDDRHDAAVARLVEYDRSRRSELVSTLEQYLRDRRSSVTARALYIHPNTLRQRLDRIEKLSGLDLAREDLMSLELAVKLANLRSAGGPA
ncbi:MAG: GAF domain-containing protein [Solirubrobacterales bacterium]|jgi:GAF domain-containing protein|nr:GAF domain-containing protein [Solirubrobacterales bacterium]